MRATFTTVNTLLLGDTVGIEIEVFEEKMSVALFNKNGLPIGTRFLTEKEHSHFLPTIAICGNGSNVEIDVVWQNRIASPPVFSVVSIKFPVLYRTELPVHRCSAS